MEPRSRRGPPQLECQYNHALDPLRRIRDQGLRYIDLRPETMAARDREMGEGSAPIFWVTGGCDSGYLSSRDEHGHPGGSLLYGPTRLR